MNVKITLPDVHKMRSVRTEWALSRVSVWKDSAEQTVFVQVIAVVSTCGYDKKDIPWTEPILLWILFSWSI